MIEPLQSRQPEWYRRNRVWIAAAVLLVVLLAIGYAVRLFQPVSSNAHAERYVKVGTGQSAAAVGNTLQRRGIIRSALAFDLLSRYNGLATHLTAGVYRLSPAESLTQIMNQMRSGDVVVITVSIPEGFTVKEITERLAAHHIGTMEQYRRLEQHPLPGMPKPAPGVRDPLEGYLYPATYQFSYGTGARQALTIMWHTFQARVVKGLYQPSHTKLSLTQWVTLASIVQDEAKQSSQAAEAAAVFLNRYKVGMPFQSDATVRYAMGRPLPNGLVPANLKISSPYNTYVHTGFPPGPITNPGLATLKAALHPAHVPYLYFVSLRSGRLLFATTYQQHLANIAYAKSHPNA